MGVPVGQIFQRLVASKGVKFKMSASVEKAEPSCKPKSRFNYWFLNRILNQGFSIGLVKSRISCSQVWRVYPSRFSYFRRGCSA